VQASTAMKARTATQQGHNNADTARERSQKFSGGPVGSSLSSFKRKV
jgi:hypothetical protein